MKSVEPYVQLRRAVYVEGLSRREAARRFGLGRDRIDNHAQPKLNNLRRSVAHRDEFREMGNCPGGGLTLVKN
jgi:DNA-directed RNA polymerase specialized sigma24 family protein